MKGLPSFGYTFLIKIITFLYLILKQNGTCIH